MKGADLAARDNNVGKERIIYLLIVMIFVTALTVIVAVMVLYRTAFRQEESHLLDMAESRASLIESIAKFDLDHSREDHPGGAFEATLSQIKEAHKRFRGFGKTGEIVLAARDDKQINFLVKQRHNLSGQRSEKMMTADMGSEVAEPMQKALSGLSGSMSGRDYRGEKVLAAYVPVKLYGKRAGIVVKMDISEIRSPFIMAGFAAAVAATILILAGAILFLRISNPLISKLRENEEIFRGTFEQAAVGMAVVAPSGRWIDVNDRLSEISGYSHNEIVGNNFMETASFGGLEKHVEVIRKLIGGGLHTYTTEKRFKHKDGSFRWISLTISLVRDHLLSKEKYFIFVIKDISERKVAEEKLSRAYIDLAANNERLERLNKIMSGRELMMIKLKSEINGLRKTFGQSEKYSTPPLIKNAGIAETKQ